MLSEHSIGVNDNLRLGGFKNDIQPLRASVARILVRESYKLLFSLS